MTIDVGQRQRQHPLPAQRHQLVVAEPRQRPADPDEEEQEEGDLRDERQRSAAPTSSQPGSSGHASEAELPAAEEQRRRPARDAVIMLTYSAMKNSENFIAEYSVW